MVSLFKGRSTASVLFSLLLLVIVVLLVDLGVRRWFLADVRGRTAADIVLLPGSDWQDSAEKGTTITLSFAIKNAGPSKARNVVLSQYVPPSFTFLASSFLGCEVKGRYLACPLNDLEANTTQEAMVVFEIPAEGALCQPEDITSFAAVLGGTPDANLLNNQLDYTLHLLCPALAFE